MSLRVVKAAPSRAHRRS